MKLTPKGGIPVGMSRADVRALEVAAEQFRKALMLERDAANADMKRETLLAVANQLRAEADESLAIVARLNLPIDIVTGYIEGQGELIAGFNLDRLKARFVRISGARVAART